MTTLPASIAAYLQESGFSQTELLVLRHLLERRAMTLREMAARSGKSTGVLDQAMKKLVQRRIVIRQMINDSPKYTLQSLDALLEWVRNDMQHKHNVLVRREEDLVSFFASVQEAFRRPDVQHYTGLEGLQKLYVQLLDAACREMLHVFPVMHTEEDDPLREFRIQYLRNRRKKKVFARYLAHDTPLGRRFQSRDIFAFRKTLLMDPEESPFDQEKIIAGDLVASISHREHQGLLIASREMARTEKALFETLWRREECRSAQETAGCIIRRASPVQSMDAGARLGATLLREAVE